LSGTNTLKSKKSKAKIQSVQQNSFDLIFCNANDLCISAKT